MWQSLIYPPPQIDGSVFFHMTVPCLKKAFQQEFNKYLINEQRQLCPQQAHREGASNRLYKLIISIILQLCNYLHFTEEEMDAQRGKHAQDMVGAAWQSQEFVRSMSVSFQDSHCGHDPSFPFCGSPSNVPRLLLIWRSNLSWVSYSWPVRVMTHRHLEDGEKFTVAHSIDLIPTLDLLLCFAQGPDNTASPGKCCRF